VKRVLVTGASGFIGRQTIGPLLERGYEVHAVGRNSTDPRAQWHHANLLDQGQRRQMVRAVRPDSLIHCAWFTKHGAYWEAAENLDWVAASLDLARFAVDSGTSRLVIAGTCAEYDWTNGPSRPWREDEACQPASLYGKAKDALHRLLTPFAASAGAGLVWARLFHLYGPYEPPARLVPWLLTSLREGRHAVIGSANAVRDFMHSADAGRALAHLLDSDATGAINVASGQPVRLGALAGMVAALAERPDLLALSDARPASPPVVVADTTALRATGFSPSITLHDGLAALWDPDRHALPAPRARDYEDAARLYRAGRYDAARATAESVIAAKPAHAAALNLLGVLHRLRADFAAARDCLQRAAELDPDKETAWINLGNVHLDMEDADAAVIAYGKALAVAPQRFDTLRILGNSLARAGRDSEAMERLDQAVAAVPGSIAMLRDRARAHFTAGRGDAALADLDAALAAQPDDTELCLIKAQMLRLSNRGDEAAEQLRALVAAAPDNADVHLALADALLAEEQREQANAHYRQAVELRPEDQTARGKLCWSLLNSRYGSEAKHIADAHELARQLVRGDTLHPGNAHAVQSALMRVADLEGLEQFDRLFPDRTVLLDYWVRRNVIGALHAQLGRVRTMQDRLQLMDYHRHWGERYEAKTVPLRPHRSPLRERIRVGFVSSDLRHHPVSYFALPIFQHYDRDRFDVTAYSFFPGQPDAVQQEIAGRVDTFRLMPNRSEDHIAQTIADDRLDILFELGGSTHLNRLEIMAHQPAPIQVSWLGYPHSAGLSRIARIMVDPYLKPPDPRLLLEQPFEMPSSWVCLGPLGFTDRPILPTLPEERTGRVTFGTMNNPYKYSPEAFALWARVLQSVPGSRFLLVRPESGVPAFRNAVERAFALHGITADRLAYVPVRGVHMQHYNDIDIALDTLPQTGGTTTCECLWMGVPTVSLVGPAFYERLSYSNLVNAGLGDLAVDTHDAYVAAAAGLVADRDRRRALRQELRETIRRSALGDTRRWVADFEALTLRTLGA